MTNEQLSQESKNRAAAKPETKPADKAAAPPTETPAQKIQRIQREVGNRGVQRMLAQRAEGQGGAFEVDEDTQDRINNLRGGGQPLDVGVQQRMQDAMGYDFGDVNIHTTSEASNLSQTLQAKAFTTGSDIFFNEGAYQPNTSSGQELLAHELTHVVQQGSGQVTGNGESMTVNAPDDAFEQQADSAAREAMSTSTGAAVPGAQRESLPEEEEEPVQAKALDTAVQREGVPEEELLQGKPLDALQRETLPEEEEQPLQMQELDDEEMEQGM